MDNNNNNCVYSNNWSVNNSTLSLQQQPKQQHTESTAALHMEVCNETAEVDDEEEVDEEEEDEEDVFGKEDAFGKEEEKTTGDST